MLLKRRLQGGHSGGAALLSAVNRRDRPQTNISLGSSFLPLNANVSGTRNVHLFGFQSRSRGPFLAREGGSRRR